MSEAIVPILMAISAAASVATGVAAFSKPKPPTAPTAEQTRTKQAAAAQAAAQAQAAALSHRRGMASTVLTSPLGVTDGTQTQRATLGA